MIPYDPAKDPNYPIGRSTKAEKPQPAIALTREPGAMVDERDMVNHPPHYTTGGIECIEALEAMTATFKGFEAYALGNVVKYIWRYNHKGSALENLRKAKWYLDRVILKLETDPK